MASNRSPQPSGHPCLHLAGPFLQSCFLFQGLLHHHFPTAVHLLKTFSSQFFSWHYYVISNQFELLTFLLKKINDFLSWVNAHTSLRIHLHLDFLLPWSSRSTALCPARPGGGTEQCHDLSRGSAESVRLLSEPLVCSVLWTQKTWTAKPAKCVNTGWGFSDTSTVFHMAHRSCGLVSRSQGRLSSCSPTWLLADWGTRQPHPDWAMRGEKLALPVQQTKCLGEVFYKGAY